MNSFNYSVAIEHNDEEGEQTLLAEFQNISDAMLFAQAKSYVVNAPRAVTVTNIDTEAVCYSFEGKKG